MKRWLLHVLFWVAYTFQDALMEYTWSATLMAGVPEGKRFLIALHAAFAATMPKLVITYFVLYAALPQVLKDKRSLVWIAVQVVTVMAVSLLLYRLTFYYYIHNTVYGGAGKQGKLFSPAMLLLGIMDIGFACGAAVTFKLLRMQLSAKVREKDLVKEKLETELKFLRNQTNPHFLFNTLNNIYALTRKKSDEAPEIVMKLSKLLRFMLYESGKGMITIAEEIRMINDYLDLERIRYNNRLNVTFTQHIDQEQHPVAPLLLMPFVENAFKHGVSETRFDSYVHMDLRLQKGMLTFTVENNREHEGSNSQHKIGLGNVRRQLELMYTEHQLLVFSEANVFKVVLTINLDSHAKI